jgi:hypothetical protein
MVVHFHLPQAFITKYVMETNLLLFRLSTTKHIGENTYLIVKIIQN